MSTFKKSSLACIVPIEIVLHTFKPWGICTYLLCKAVWLCCCCHYHCCWCCMQKAFKQINNEIKESWYMMSNRETKLIQLQIQAQVFATDVTLPESDYLSTTAINMVTRTTMVLWCFSIHKCQKLHDVLLWYWYPYVTYSVTCYNVFCKTSNTRHLDRYPVLSQKVICKLSCVAVFDPLCWPIWKLPCR